MFGVLVISCSMAAISTRYAPHAAAVAGPMALLSAVMVVMESLHGGTQLMALFQLSLVYTALMIFQSCAVHHRFNRTWELEQDRERLVENLRAAKAESDRAHRDAIAASRAKSEFLANMSHELRTPLNAIIGFSDIVRTKAFGDATNRYSEYGGFIFQSGHHLLGLIGDILDLAKIESGRKKLMPEPIDLIGLVRDEGERARARAAEKSVRVAVELPDSIPLLHADLYAVRQITAHLLSNAVKYTQSQGNVEVSVSLNETGEIELCVADTGIGIPKEDRAHLFDRFGHARPEVTTPHRGSGLGLPIVKGLVDMHGGRIALTSELGEGTTVTVVFPAESTLRNFGRVA
jgi:two-component system cell cycle sensor histidine kinase PleC